MGGHDGVQGVVAVDPHGPEHGHEEGVHKDARQGVQREHQGPEGPLNHVVDVEAEHKPDGPEEDHQEQQGHERQERLIDDWRHAVGKPDNKVRIREQLLDANGDERHEDRREESL